MKKLIRPAMLIVPLATGIFFPQAAILAQSPYNFIRWALGAMIFFNVLQINFADLKPRREHWLILGCNVLLGIVPFFLLKLIFPESDAPAQAAFFTGIAPTATAAAVIVSLLNGHVGFAITGFLITNIGISLALLGLIPLITGNFSAAFLLNVFYSILTAIIIPMVCARIARFVYPGILKYTGKFKNITLCLWSASLFVIAAIAREYFDRNNNGAVLMLLLMIAIAAILCAASFACGYFVCKSSGFRRDASQILGQKNTTFAIYLAIEYSSGIAALATIFYVLFHNLWNSIQLLQKKEGSAEN